MSKSVRIPEDLHEELKARKRPDETMAEVIERHLHRPHPAETREMLSADAASAVADEIETLSSTDSNRLDRVRETFESDDKTREGR